MIMMDRNDSNNKTNDSSSSQSPDHSPTASLEHSQIFMESIIILWDVLKNVERMKSFLVLHLGLDEDTEFKDCIQQNLHFIKSIVYTSTYVTATFTVRQNTIDDTSVLTVNILGPKNVLSNQDIPQQIYGSIREYLEKNANLSKHFSSTMIKGSINDVWDLVTKWEYDKIGLNIEEVNLNGDPLQVGTEIELMVNRELDSLCKVKQVEDKNITNTWHYDIIPIQGKITAAEVHFTFVKVNENLTFLSIEHEFKYRITEEEKNALTKRKKKFFKAIKVYIEK